MNPLARLGQRRWFAGLLAAALIFSLSIFLSDESVQAQAQQETAAQCRIGAGGTISVDGGAPASSANITVACGTEVEITATADPGYCVDEWLLQDKIEGCQPTSVYTHAPIHAGSVHYPWVKFKQNPNPPPLTLSLSSSRDLCTANTLTELSWEITGGTPPYTLTIEGKMVDLTKGSVKVNCGPLTIDPFTGDPLLNQSKAFSATATDSQSPPETTHASVTVELAEALAAPGELSHWSNPVYAVIWWDDVAGVGLITRETDEGRTHTFEAYVVRYRAADTSEWTYVLDEGGYPEPAYQRPGPGLHVMSVAAMRDEIEQLTPEALQWSEPHHYRLVTTPANVMADTSHDTVTVSWDNQPHGTKGSVSISPGIGSLQQYFPIATAPGRASVVFDDLPPNTTFTVSVRYDVADWSGGSTSIEVTTLMPPLDYEPLLSGPRNLRASATHNRITVSWDASRPDTPQQYGVRLRIHGRDGVPISLPIGFREVAPGGQTSVTFGEDFPPVWPEHTYKVTVLESGVPGGTASITVSTPVAPATAEVPQSDSSAAAPDPFDPETLYPFLPTWPLRLDTVYALTDDPFDWHRDRYHTVACGTEVEITATADPGYCVDEWLLQDKVEGCQPTSVYTHAPIHAGSVHYPWVKFKQDPKPPPLTLSLSSSRDLCTANTLTELSWEIAGGTPPYMLTIEGEAIDLTAESVRVNCGPLTMDPLTGDPLLNQMKMFSGAVTDSHATPVSVTATAQVELAEPLTAPENVHYWSYVVDVMVNWDRVPGAGSQSPRGVDPETGRDTRINGAVRTRAVDATQWEYQTLEFARQSQILLDPLPGLRVLSLAAVRHPLELETPEALSWSAEFTYAATTEAQNVVIGATHDTVTVSWDRQPYARGQKVQAILSLDEDFWGSRRDIAVWEEEGITGRHQVIFSHLPPKTDFFLKIWMVDNTYGGAPHRYAVRTKAAPADWKPLPLGAQNLRVTTSAEGYTIAWDPPSPSAYETWHLDVDNAVTANPAFRTWTHGATTWMVPRAQLRPATRYRLTVSHHDLEETETSIEFTTPAASVTEGTDSSAGEGVGELNQLAFFPVWPVALDDRYAMTDDPFQ